MSKKDRLCSVCGESCYGDKCRGCYVKSKYGGLSRQVSRKNYYANKQV